MKFKSPKSRLGARQDSVPSQALTLISSGINIKSVGSPSVFTHPPLSKLWSKINFETDFSQISLRFNLLFC